ncbi:Lon protease-like protein, mitochondrial [Frankliniella fusca]|uniref:Lon protease-like protein, mitochondrial n=1 Tax=Frankliniella fusca TaxID=407009 RepID=A0AAE1HNQ0_9NEOP|nr:Lon protease-like protein, mitochondrial [Frankliniella fusca]
MIVLSPERWETGVCVRGGSACEKNVVRASHEFAIHLQQHAHAALAVLQAVTVLNAAYLLVLLWQTVRSPPAFALRVPLRLAVGTYSSLVARFVWILRGHLAREALDKAAALARDVELEAEAAAVGQYGASPIIGEGRERLREAGRSVRKIMRYMAWYMTVAGGLVMVTLALEWPTPDVVLLGFSVSCSMLGYYLLVAMQLSLFVATAALLDLIPRPLTAEAGLGPIRRASGRLVRAQGLCRAADRVWCGLVPHVLLTVLLMPLFSSAELIIFRGKTDPFAFGAIPAIGAVFVSLCFAGQCIQDAGRAVPDRCYAGPWLSEAPGVRRARLFVMLSFARPTPCAVHIYSRSTFDRPTCGDALRAWFSFMQVICNLSSR